MNCPSQTVEKLKHFVSKNAFNIEGLGDKLINMLFKEKIINDFSDIFKIYKYKELLEKREGLGKLSVSNLLNSIESKKKILQRNKKNNLLPHGTRGYGLV